MGPEVILAGAALVGVGFTGGGLIYTIRKNGSAQKTRDIALAEAQAARDAVTDNNQKAILARLDDKESGLQAVNIKVAEQATNCAKVSTALTERIAGQGREIKELKEHKHQ